MDWLKIYVPAGVRLLMLKTRDSSKQVVPELEFE